MAMPSARGTRSNHEAPAFDTHGVFLGLQSHANTAYAAVLLLRRRLDGLSEWFSFHGRLPLELGTDRTIVTMLQWGKVLLAEHPNPITHFV